MKIIKLIAVGLGIVLIISTVSISAADDSCKTVNGHISSQVVSTLPDGEVCSSPIGLCTAGEFVGGVQGDFTFIAEGIVPNPDLENPDVQFTTGELTLNTKEGSLRLRDASAVSFGPDGLFSSVQTIVEGTEDLEGATGRLRAYGVFQGGCVDCDYRGEVCTP